MYHVQTTITSAAANLLGDEGSLSQELRSGFPSKVLLISTARTMMIIARLGFGGLASFNSHKYFPVIPYSPSCALVNLHTTFLLFLRRYSHGLSHLINFYMHQPVTMKQSCIKLTCSDTQWLASSQFSFEQRASSYMYNAITCILFCLLPFFTTEIHGRGRHLKSSPPLSPVSSQLCHYGNFLFKMTSPLFIEDIHSAWIRIF